MPNKLTQKYFIALAIILIVTALNAVLLKKFDVIGVPTFFAVALLLQLVLVILLIYSLIVVLRTPIKIAWSIIVSALQGVESNKYVQQVLKYVPFLIPWIERRFSRKRANGLILTTGAVLAIIFLALFIMVASAVISGTYAGIDSRIINLMPNIRTAGENTFFSMFTFAASYIGILFLIIAIGIIGWFRRQRWLPVAFLFAYGLEVLFSEVIKYGVHRPRPDNSLRELVVSGFSFPSGHTLAATVVYGLLTYLIFRYVKSHVAKIFVAMLGLTFIVLGALSRVYFGVHYPSDALGSIVLGCFLLTMLVTLIEMNIRYHIFSRVKFTYAMKSTLFIALGGLVVFTLLVSSKFTHYQAVTRNVPTEGLVSIDSNSIIKLPHYSETLTGARMEPINFIFVGSETQITNAFERSGWSKADAPTPSNTFKEMLSAAQNKQYLNAPVTPSYLSSQPQNLAFEKPTVANTSQQRHHTRIWKTAFTVGGQPVWVATASLDDGIEVGSTIPLPTHHINPNIDSEREYITTSLNLTNTYFIQVVPAELGANASGDGFFTDGRAVVVPFR